MDAEEGGHEDQLLDLRVVVAVVEELIEPIAGLLRLGHEQEVMPDLLLGGRPDVPERESRELLDVGVVDCQVRQVHQEEVDDLLVLDVVTAHLVEGELRLQDVVAEVEDHEALAHHPDDVGALRGQADTVDVPLGVPEGVDVEDEPLEVLAVEGDDVLVDELPLHRVQATRLPLLLLAGEDVILHLLSYHLHELTVIGFLYYPMG